MDSLTTSEFAATVAVLSYIGLVFAAGISDILTFTVPNRFSAAIALLYPTYVMSASGPVDWQGAILIAFGATVFGFVLYALGGWGGGDAKLFGAAALWAGPNMILEFTLITMLTGGVITIFVYLQHYLPHLFSTGFFRYRDAVPSLKGSPIPYGAAIAVSALYGAFTLLKVS